MCVNVLSELLRSVAWNRKAPGFSESLWSYTDAKWKQWYNSVRKSNESIPIHRFMKKLLGVEYKVAVFEQLRSEAAVYSHVPQVKPTTYRRRLGTLIGLWRSSRFRYGGGCREGAW